MAKQPDDQKPQRKRDDTDPTTPVPRERINEVEEVLDAEEVKSDPVEETHSARPSPQPTRIAPYQADAVEEPSDVNDVFADEAGHAPRSSSIIEVAELAEIVEDESPEAVPLAPAAPVTPSPPMGDDLFVSDVVDSQDQPGPETSSIFGKSSVRRAKPAPSDSVAGKEKAFEEIMSAETAGKRGPALPEDSGHGPGDQKVEAAEIEDETVDLGSDPDVHMDPSRPQRIKKEKTRAAAEEAAHATEEIDWNDIIEDEALAADDPGAKGDAKPLSGAEAEEAHAAGDQAGATIRGEVKDEVIFDDLDSEMDDVPPSKRGTKAARKHEDEATVFEEDSDAPQRQEEDDVQFDEAETLVGKKEQVSEHAIAAEAPKAISGEEDGADPKKALAAAADQDADDLAAHALLDDDEGLAAKEIADVEDAAAGAEADEELPDEGEPVAGEKKGKMGADEEERELVGAGAGKHAGKPPAAPRSRRGLLAGMCTATLVLVAGSAAVWYAKPDLLEEAYKISPNYTPPKKDKAKVESPVARARARMDNREFDQALDILQNADKTPLNLSTRAEARWLKYLQGAGAEKPLDKNAPEVKLVLADLDEAGNDLLKAQVTRALDGGGGKGNEKDLVELEERVKKAEDAKKDAENNLAKFHDALVKEKFLDGTDKLDPAAFGKFVKELGDSKTSLAAVNKLLEDAKIQDAGDKGVARLLTTKKDADEKLEAINKLLADAKFKDEGAKGLAEMIAAQDKLAKERDELEQAVKAAYQELSSAGLVAPSDDPRAQIVEAVKIARQKAESAANTLKELTEPAANYLPRAEKLAAQGNLKEALDVLNLGLKALPDNPRLLALRALVRLEGAHGDRKRIEAVQKEIRQDAEKAVGDAATAAEGAYVLGLLDESLGNYDRAENDYRKALTAHRGGADEASRYIIALARLLQRDRAAGAAPAAPPNGDPAAPQKEKDNVQPPKKADPKTDQTRRESMRALVALVVATQGVDAGNDTRVPASTRIQESIGLANKLIQSANPKIKGQGHMILGQAMFKNGKRAEGLKEYVSGLEILYPGDGTRDMFKLLANAPVNQPEAESPRINPVLAEQLFGRGLDLFWSRRYAEAETQFKQASQHHQDARFEYYLGMALMAQQNNSKRQAAYAAFEQGARLEASNRPSMGEVNASMERIQGSLRSFVNSFRQKARPAANW